MFSIRTHDGHAVEYPHLAPEATSFLAIDSTSSQVMGSMNFASSLVRKLDERKLELMRKKSTGEFSGFLQLMLSPDLKSLVITHNGTAGEPQIFAFDRQLHG